MKKIIVLLLLHTCFLTAIYNQEIIPIDTSRWEISGDYIIEPYKGRNSIYIKGGSMKLKDLSFLNGCIEFDLFLKETPSFPGVYFRLIDDKNGEQFYVRPHQSGNPDANQGAPLINGITPWQLMFGPSYSKPYDYKFNDWTHVKIVVNGDKAQVYFDHSEDPFLSWHLTHGLTAGEIVLRGGGREAIHIADVRVDPNAYQLKDFNVVERKPIEDLVSEWAISQKFDESLLDTSLDSLIQSAKFDKSITIDEGTAANISRVVDLFDGEPGNTVFAKLEIDAEIDQIKKFDFGYSDRVVAILNGKPIYWGTNRWRSRDYRYLGTIGLFDAIYLDLKKGKNTLLMAVSEDFGGWLITGSLED